MSTTETEKLNRQARLVARLTERRLTEFAKMRAAMGAQLQAARNAVGLTQKELADKAGIHSVALSVLERGIHFPRPRTLARLEAALWQARRERRMELRRFSGLSVPKAG